MSTNTIVSISKQYAADPWNAKDAQGVADALATVTVPVTNTNGVTMGEIGVKLGFPAQVQVSDTLRRIIDGSLSIPEGYAIYKGVIIDARDRLLADTGMTLYSADRQQLLDIVGQIGGWSTELVSALKSLGLENRPLWQYVSLVHTPTVEEVQEAMDAEDLRIAWIGKQELINGAKSINEMIATLSSIVSELGG